MEIEDLESVSKVLSFTELQVRFEEFITSGKAESSPDLFVLGYSSLISYPAITLIKEFNAKELQAAQKCYDMMLQYSKSNLQEMAQSDNEKSKLAASLLIIPPAKRLLASCNEFYMLDYLIRAASEGINKKDIDGNEYAKQWNNLLIRGYKGEQTEKAIMDEHDHRVLSMRAIKEMSLTPESEALLSEDRVQELMKTYFKSNPENGTGTGCAILILITGALGLLVSCI